MKKILILGSSGSIGTQTLDVVDNSKNSNMQIEVRGLSVFNNVNLLFLQILKYKPKAVCVIDEGAYFSLKEKLKANNINITVFLGNDGLVELVKAVDYDVLVNSVVGIVGLIPTIEAIKLKKDIALANKETLVAGGELIMNMVKEYGVKLLPLDSEHSAIFQGLQGNKQNKIKKIHLTASGGSFRDKSLSELENVTIEDALKHPNWSMGKKITIDSATLMNKGLEVIEAKWLFDLKPEQIDVVIHRQSIVHSLVEYMDNTLIAELSEPDMRHPIQYALNYPYRLENNCKSLNLLNLNLSFEPVKNDIFPCLSYAYDSLNYGGNMCVVYNSANEEAVSLFLEGKIKFLDIQKMVYGALMSFTSKNINEVTLENILYADFFARKFVIDKFNNN
ncbi:MAG: 1-deoxy-D-xylulose-5-phosphate reductoisomerase [Lachnospirales bacterium]